MKKVTWPLCVISILTLVSVSFGAEKILLGDFESAPVENRYDTWFSDGLSMVSVLSPGVTRGTHALKCTSTAGADFWGPAIQIDLDKLADNDGSGIADAVETAIAPESHLVVDYTAFAADYTGGVGQLGFVLNCAASSGGWDKSGAQDMILDGEPHRMVFTITETAKEKILEGTEGWGSNIGFYLNITGPGPIVYFDNIWLLPTAPEDDLLPYDPSVDQTKIDNEVEEATFHWLAAADPNKDSGFAVEPNIVDQYVFLNDGEGGELYYIGKTGSDPGDTPESQYGPVTLNLNTTYLWAVVEAIEGYEQVFDTTSTLNDVEPNNLIGPVWELKTINTLPVITAQPVHGHAPLGAKDVEAFTIGVADPAATYYQWYNSADNVIDSGDFALTSTTATTDTLLLGTGTSGIVMGHQKYYYCKLYNTTTTSGGGTADDVYSDVVAFVPERIVAQYDFENELTDSAPITTDRHNGTGVNSPNFAAGIDEGTYALSLNGTNQYVSLGTEAYPKAVMADGIGGGLEMGSILCWVKATQNGTILGNADPNTTVAFQTVGNGTAMTVRGNKSVQTAYAANPYYAIVNDGYWHLLAATWDMNGQIKLHVDTTLVEGQTNTSTFSPWINGMLIGAGRPNSDDYTEIGNLYGGLIDNLRVYNYVVTPETIAQEYYDKTGTRTCTNPDFSGSEFNFDDTGASYCRIDLADFAIFAQNWLTDGFYPEL